MTINKKDFHKLAGMFRFDQSNNDHKEAGDSYMHVRYLHDFYHHYDF